MGHPLHARDRLFNHGPIHFLVHTGRKQLRALGDANDRCYVLRYSLRARQAQARGLEQKTARPGHHRRNFDLLYRLSEPR